MRSNALSEIDTAGAAIAAGSKNTYPINMDTVFRNMRALRVPGNLCSKGGRKVFAPLRASENPLIAAGSSVVCQRDKG